MSTCLHCIDTTTYSSLLMLSDKMSKKQRSKSTSEFLFTANGIPHSSGMPGAAFYYQRKVVLARFILNQQKALGGSRSTAVIESSRYYSGSMQNLLASVMAKEPADEENKLRDLEVIHADPNLMRGSSHDLLFINDDVYELRDRFFIEVLIPLMSMLHIIDIYVYRVEAAEKQVDIRKVTFENDEESGFYYLDPVFISDECFAMTT